MFKLAPVVKDFVETISSAPADSSKLQEVLHSIGDLLEIHKCGNLNQRFSLSDSDLVLVKNVFLKYHYTKVLQIVIQKFTVEWISELSKAKSSLVELEDLFLRCPGDASVVSFVVLCREIHSNRLVHCLQINLYDRLHLFLVIVFLSTSSSEARASRDHCILGRKSGILRIQYGHAATAEISFWTR